MRRTEACCSPASRRSRLSTPLTGDGGRYGFGVMMKRDQDGELTGHRMKPFNYSDRELVVRPQGAIRKQGWAQRLDSATGLRFN